LRRMFNLSHSAQCAASRLLRPTALSNLLQNLEMRQESRK
jgi:hypothetical protein